MMLRSNQKERQRKKGQRKTLNDSGIGESFNVTIEFFKYNFYNIELYLLFIFVIKNSILFKGEYFKY